MKTAN